MLYVNVHVGFKQFCEVMNPSVVLPSRRTLGRLVNKAFLDGKKSLHGRLQSVSNIAVTSDLWSDRRHRSYVTVTIHFVDDKWRLHHLVVSTRRIFGRRTAADIEQICSTIFTVSSFKILE